MFKEILADLFITGLYYSIDLWVINGYTKKILNMLGDRFALPLGEREEIALRLGIIGAKVII